MTNEDLRIHEYNMDKIELYQDLIEQFKICLAIDEGRSKLDEETLDIIRDVKNEIINLREGIAKTKKETLEIYDDCVHMAAQLYKLETLDKIKDIKVKKNIQDFFELYFFDDLFLIKKNIDKVVKLFSEMDYNG